jgi:polyhydroxyalkanoate synthesis repressor PhaR
MPVIKRYPNRKLYDTRAKQYITLDGIAALIRQGEEITVVDHATGEDLTAVTLSQIILEQQRKGSGFLPESVLAGLVRAGGETLSTLRRGLALPLDLARQVDEEIEKRLQALVNRGAMAADDAQRLRGQLLALGRQAASLPWLTEQQLERVLARQDLPSRDDLHRVLDRLDDLSASLDELIAGSGEGA